jgi:stalled ribosome alternative rescue factor ArfA
MTKREKNMKHFLIKYRLKSGSKEEWHQGIARFIATLDSDPALKGKISYRCMKRRDGDDYYHWAAPADDEALKALQGNELFRRYTEKTKLVAADEVEVLPLEIIAETQYRA